MANAYIEAAIEAQKLARDSIPEEPHEFIAADARTAILYLCDAVNHLTARVELLDRAEKARQR